MRPLMIKVICLGLASFGPACTGAQYPAQGTSPIPSLSWPAGEQYERTDPVEESEKNLHSPQNYPTPRTYKYDLPSRERLKRRY